MQMKGLQVALAWIFWVSCQAQVDQLVFEESFDSYNAGAIPYGTGEDGDLVVLEDCDGLNKCLRVKYEPTDNGSRRLSAYEPLAPSSNYTASYDVYFEDEFEWVRGGKLPGLSGGSATTGCDPMTPAGWSVRLMWKSHGTLIIYIYDQHRTEECGNSIPIEGFAFQTSQWYHIELTVGVNTPGQQDGDVSLAVNGEPVMRVQQLEFRGNVDSSVALVDNFLFSTFYGGSDSTWAPSNTTFARFDNFAVRQGSHLDREEGQEVVVTPPSTSTESTPTLKDYKRPVTIGLGVFAGAVFALAAALKFFIKPAKPTLSVSISKKPQLPPL